ncbi:hypothetical protein LCGC14_2410270, partial [marine sediment metagenome]
MNLRHPIVATLTLIAVCSGFAGGSAGPATTSAPTSFPASTAPSAPSHADDTIPDAPRARRGIFGRMLDVLRGNPRMRAGTIRSVPGVARPFEAQRAAKAKAPVVVSRKVLEQGEQKRRTAQALVDKIATADEKELVFLSSPFSVPAIDLLSDV